MGLRRRWVECERGARRDLCAVLPHATALNIRALRERAPPTSVAAEVRAVAALLTVMRVQRRKTRLTLWRNCVGNSIFRPYGRLD